MLFRSQISSSLQKVRTRGYTEAEAALKHLRDRLRGHRLSENDTPHYLLKRAARQIFRRLPPTARENIKSLYSTLLS